MEKFTIANGTAFRYIDAGKGEETILLIHGYLESIEVWDSLISKMGKEYRLIAFDIPGHGISEVKGEVHTMQYVADTAAALLDSIGVKGITVVGHSMGGYVAQALAKSRPDIVNKLVLLHSTPDCDSDEKRENREREIEVIATGRKELLASINPGKAFAKDNIKKFAEEIEDLSLQAMITEDEGIIALLKGMMVREDMNSVIDNMGERVMMVFGKKDQFMPIEYCESIALKHPRAEILWLEESGHSGFIEQQPLFIEKLSEFICK